MRILLAFTIAIGVAMDAFAVSVTNGMVIKHMHAGYAAKTALSFAVFQSLMPVIGWFVGIYFSENIEAIDRYLACLLLVAVGIKLIYEAIKESKHGSGKAILVNGISTRLLITLSLATSIDALAVGMSFACTGVDSFSFLFIDISIIGAVTFSLCFAGAYIGHKFGDMFKGKAEICGGCVLIITGIKIALFG